MTDKIIPFYEPIEDDSRPLPLLVAGTWGFALQHYDKSDGVWYSVIDWIAGIGTTDTFRATETWRKIQPTLQEILKSVMLYRDIHGNDTQSDFTNDVGLYRIAQEMRVTKKRPALKEIKDYLAKAGAFADLARREPETVAAKLAAQRERKYLRAGKEQEWIADREFGIVSRNQLMAIIKHLLGDESKDIYRLVTDDTYIGVFGMPAWEMRQYLGIPSGANVRDFMSRLGLIFVAQAEEICRLELEGYQGDDIVTPQDVRKVIKTLSHLVGEQVKITQQKLGIDVLTGKKLLQSGNEDQPA